MSIFGWLAILILAGFLIFVGYGIFLPNYKKKKDKSPVTQIPQKRERSKLLSARHGGICDIVSYERLGSSGKLKLTLNTKNEENVKHIVYEDEIERVSKNQTAFGVSAPLYITIETLQQILNNFSNKNSDIRRVANDLTNIRDKNEELRKENNVLNGQVIDQRANNKREVNQYIERMSVISRNLMGGKY
jgi:TRAP-type C4-dicarboxylate transport system permease small subunit